MTRNLAFATNSPQIVGAHGPEAHQNRLFGHQFLRKVPLYICKARVFEGGQSSRIGGSNALANVRDWRAMCVSIPASYREPLADGLAVGRQHGRRGVAGTRSSARAVRTPTAPPGTRAKGGHYLVGLKGNQPTPHLEARLFFQEQPPRALLRATSRTRHGSRHEIRQLRAGPTLLPCRSTNIQLPTTSGHTTNHYIAMHDDEMTLRLARPSHLPEQLPHMAVGVLDPEQPSDHRSHTRTGPQVRGVPMGAWTPQEFLPRPIELLLQLRLARWPQCLCLSHEHYYEPNHRCPFLLAISFEKDSLSSLAGLRVALLR